MLQMTSIEPGPDMDRMLALALSLHAASASKSEAKDGSTTSAAAREDDLCLHPYLDLQRALQGTQHHLGCWWCVDADRSVVALRRIPSTSFTANKAHNRLRRLKKKQRKQPGTTGAHT
jgi:hypothetical protein